MRRWGKLLNFGPAVPMKRGNDVTHPNRAFCISPWLLSLTAGVAGYVLNGFGLPVFGGTEVVFGGCLTLLTTYRYGPAWGALATAIAFSRTWLVWGHPYGLCCVVLESLVVGWLIHRRDWSPLKAGLCYWAILGLPVTAFTVWVVRAVPFPSNWAIFIKYPTNSLLMAMVAISIFHLRAFQQFTGMPANRDARLPLRDVLSRRFGIIIVLAIAALGLVAGRIFDRSLRELSQEELANDSRELASVLSTTLDRHQRAMSLVAAEVSANRADGAEALAGQLELVRRDFPLFLTTLCADADGRIVAASPAAGRNGQAIAGAAQSVADRDYFREPMRTGRPFVSQVFQGRGVGTNLIVAMSAPVRDAGGKTVMVVEGSLDVGQLPRAVGLAGLLDGRTLVILDQHRRVVAASGRLEAPPLLSAHALPVFEAAKLAASPSAIAFDGINEGRLERFLGARADVARFGWEIYLAEPLWHAQFVVAEYYGLATFWAAVMIAFALLLAGGTAKEITRPLNQLAAAVRQLGDADAGDDLGSVPHVSRELADICRDLHGAALDLSRSNRDLATAIVERDESFIQLQEAKSHLEEKVHERTRQLETARQDAEAANHAKSEFLASMSHELRTPLNVILGMSELVGERHLGPLNERQAEGLQAVHESGRHLLAVINDILDLSKIEAGVLTMSFQTTVVADVCAASMRFVREAARKKNITLETAFRQSATSLVADEQRLKQILVNLLVNAVKFTPAGGRVGLEVLSVASPPGLRFVVWDTGIGIAPEQAGRLFTPFQQIDSSLTRQYSGTGLGLALVKRMAQLHGGSVDLESESGRGSRFGVTLPLRPATAEAGDPEATIRPEGSKAPVAPGPLRILIAEDNEANVQVYAGHLGPRGHQLTIAQNGREAVDQAQAELPDLVLMDVHMPVMDGLSAIKLLRADPRTARLPIIAVTALAMAEDRQRCLDAGADDYLSKPINLRELSRAIARLARPPAPAAVENVML